jgi:hypothetical protein
MRFSQRAIISCAAAVALIGCRSSGNTELLKQENFQLSEQVLKLEVQLDQLCRELSHCRQQLATRDSSPTPAEPRRRDGGGTGSGTESPSDLPKPPKVELGPSNKGSSSTPKPESAPKFTPRTSTEAAPPSAAPGGGPSLPAFHQTAAGSKAGRVAQITLDPQLTEGWDADPKRPGDEGLLVVVQPRDEKGLAMHVAGEVVISAWDTRMLAKYLHQPAQQQLAHVGTWNFNAQDAATWLDPQEPRLTFELRWPPAGGPKNPDLNVFVQFTTADGRKLEATTQVRVQFTGRRAQRKPTSSGERLLDEGSAPAPPHDNALTQEHSALKSRPKRTTDAKETSDARNSDRPVWKPFR